MAAFGVTTEAKVAAPRGTQFHIVLLNSSLCLWWRLSELVNGGARSDARALGAAFDPGRNGIAPRVALGGHGQAPFSRCLANRGASRSAAQALYADSPCRHSRQRARFPLRHEK